MKRILVAYVSDTGSTKGVAQEIAKVLSEAGHAAELRPVAEAGDPAAFEAVIVGAPVNGFRWRAEALDYVTRHRETLAARPTGLFLLSIMYGLGRPSAKKRALRFLDPALALLPGAKAGYFGGTMQGPAPGILRLAFGVKKDAPLDSRDWEAVRDWARAYAKAIA